MTQPNSATGRPIIVVRRARRRNVEHHGGAWKVAYADFVTAMMAFFLVMWLVTAVSKDQRAAIFEYFKNPSMEPGKSVKPAPGQFGPGGASTSPIDLHGGLDSIHARVSSIADIGATAAPTPNRRDQTEDGAAGKTGHDPSLTAEQERQAREKQQALERQQLESLMAQLRQAVSKSQALEPFKDQLLLDITPEGVRIQIVDAQNRPMFDLGSARLRDYTADILHELAPYLDSVPNRISLTGHTDTRAYAGTASYTNWELSADRANAARRALSSAGLPDDKVARVVGLGSSVLFDKANPQNPINRRISIVVMTRRAEQDALKTDVASATPGPQGNDTTASTAAGASASTNAPTAITNAPAPAPVASDSTSPTAAARPLPAG